MSSIRAFIVLAIVAVIGIPASVSEGALSAAAGGSGLSGTLSKNKAIRKQQLICDPNEPTAGSTSVNYDPSVVTVSGLTFGPGYSGNAFIELEGAEGPFLFNLSSYLAEPFGTETGYIQIKFGEGGVITRDNNAQAAVNALHGQIPVAPGYTQIDEDGPASVDTHALTFDYLPNVSDDTIANYKIWASGDRGIDEDFLEGYDGENYYRVGYADIAPANVSGSLNSVPLPPAVYMGGLTLLGAMYTAMKRRKSAA